MIRVIQEFPSLPIFNQPEVDLCIGIYFMPLKMAMPYQILARFVHLRLLYETYQTNQSYGKSILISNILSFFRQQQN